MQNDKSTFEKLIREDRATRESQTWRGTFLDYLELVRADPEPAQAGARPHALT